MSHLSNFSMILSISQITIMIQIAMIVLLGLFLIGRKLSNQKPLLLAQNFIMKTNQSVYPDPGSTNYSPYDCYCYNYKNTFPVGLATVIQARVIRTSSAAIPSLRPSEQSRKPWIRESLLWIWKMKFLQFPRTMSLRGMMIVSNGIPRIEHLNLRSFISTIVQTWDRSSGRPCSFILKNWLRSQKRIMMVSQRLEYFMIWFGIQTLCFITLWMNRLVIVTMHTSK